MAFRRFGSGRLVVIVVGALSTAAASGPLAASLAEAGLQGVAYDRRGRGASGDTAPYAPEREVEDLRAVVDAIGSPVTVLGHSSGAALSLFAAATGEPMTHLFLSEPPLRFGHDEPPADLVDRLQSLVDEDRNEEAVLLFLREDVHLPEEAIGQLRASDMFAELVGLARPRSMTTGSSRRSRHQPLQCSRSRCPRPSCAAIPLFPSSSPPPSAWPRRFPARSSSWYLSRTITASTHAVPRGRFSPASTDEPWSVRTVVLSTTVAPDHVRGWVPTAGRRHPRRGALGRRRPCDR